MDLNGSHELKRSNGKSTSEKEYGNPPMVKAHKRGVNNEKRSKCKAPHQGRFFDREKKS